MKTLELQLNNPIDEAAIAQFKAALLQADAGIYEFLIINTGSHDFTSVKMLKTLRQTLETLEDKLRQYRKIALIYPEQYDIMSEFPELLQFFHSQQEAEDWFAE